MNDLSMMITISAFAPVQPPDNKMRPPSPQCQDENKVQQENVDVENRRILSMQCDLEDTEKKDGHLSLRILLRFEVFLRTDGEGGRNDYFVCRTT